MTTTQTIQKDKSAVFKHITEKMAETYAKKNHDYGDAFGKSVNEFGYISAVVRMNDKMERIKSLIKLENKTLVQDESIADTLLDLANYSVMTLVEMYTEK